ncbi:MAG: cellulase family glycosylhydrolase [Segetibacter sp.]|nr:cellulase family glycosylhydrolase [Segetibacter sp.]
MHRRTFIKNTSLATASVSLGTSAFAARKNKNKLPYWKGFNLTDFFTPNPNNQRRGTKEEHFKWMRDWGFNFIRLPVAYPFYLNFDRSKNITPEEVYKIDNAAVDRIDNLVQLAHKNNLHVSFNLHRAPGYCINAGFHEPYNLWKDQAAQEAFYFHWNFWAKHYKNTSKKKISFDLLNEPSMREDMNDQLSKRSAVPGDVYRKVAQGALQAIHKENKHRLVVADGNNVGNNPITEIADLDIAQSCRGYFPHAISHYKAPWANKDPEHLPMPVYPGQAGNQFLNREMLEKYYKPWIELKNKGVGVHCGECGCWNKTPHAVFLAWFNDVLDILSSNKIGFALWEFIGDFGVLNSGRADVAYEDWNSYKLDRKLLNLMQKY